MVPRRIALVAAAAMVPLIPSAPAYAADHVICVNNPVGVTCDQSYGSLAAAVTASDTNGLDDTLVVAAGTYADGPYVLNEPGHQVTLVGAGQGSTFLTMDAGGTQTYLQVTNSTVRDLTVHMDGATSDGDIGIDATTSTIESVTVDGTETSSTTGVFLDESSMSGSTVDMTRSLAASTTGVNQFANGSVADTRITATGGYYHSTAGSTATVSRVTIRSGYSGIEDSSGVVHVDNTLIDLGTSVAGVGLSAVNDNYATGTKSVDANHVTIVGGGNDSVGVGAYARAAGALQQSSISLTNSLVWGPETSLAVEASNDGSQGADSTATISTSYSDWSTQAVVAGPNGNATISSGAGRLNVNPVLVDTTNGDFRLAPTSPVIDKGAPGTGGPTLDLGNGARILDGNGDGTAVRDMGAYEAPKKVVVPDTTAPGTTITSHPRKRTTKRRVRFGFTSNEAHATFQCRLDRKAWRTCTSPRSVRVTRGWHVFKVRAIDAAHNVDPTPARFRFHRV